MTKECSVSSRTAWHWATGRRTAVDWEPVSARLTGPDTDPAATTEAYEREQEYNRLQAEYVTQTLPPELRRAAGSQVVRIAQQLSELVEDLASPEPGVDRAAQAARVRMARRRYESLGIELEELQEALAARSEGGDQTAKDEPKGD